MCKILQIVVCFLSAWSSDVARLNSSESPGLIPVTQVTERRRFPVPQPTCRAGAVHSHFHSQLGSPCRAPGLCLAVAAGLDDPRGSHPAQDARCVPCACSACSPPGCSVTPCLSRAGLPGLRRGLAERAGAWRCVFSQLSCNTFLYSTAIQSFYMSCSNLSWGLFLFL